MAVGIGLAMPAAIAYPEGAPWGAADPAAADHCASCHWERTSQPQSAQITLKGLPERVKPSTRYELELTLSDADMICSGFQVIAVAEGQPAGTFIINEKQALETAALGTMVRSSKTQDALARRVRWKFAWQAPARIDTPVIFLVAMSAANDDGSPFGDTIHTRRFDVAASR